MLINIDFGTSNSSAALILNNTIKLVQDPLNNSYLFPSRIYLTEQGQVLVGQAAENHRLQDIRRYRRNFKLALGENNKPYLVDSISNRSFKPHELVTEVLKKLNSHLAPGSMNVKTTTKCKGS